MNAKYVVFAGLEDMPETAVIFPDYVEHRAFARTLSSLLGNPIAGGFVIISDEGPIAYGESISLKLKSRGEDDTRLLRCFL
jgi:hypothetical protein